MWSCAVAVAVSLVYATECAKAGIKPEPFRPSKQPAENDPAPRRDIGNAYSQPEPNYFGFGNNLAMGIALGECLSAGVSAATMPDFSGGGGCTGGGGASGAW